MANPFVLSSALEAFTWRVGDLPLCFVGLADDRRYPWLVLVPRRPDLIELDDLDLADRHTLVDEVVAAGRAVKALGDSLDLRVEKLNVGALGNVTPQLHIHIVGRRQGDPAWPAPVWGQPGALSWELRSEAITVVQQALGLIAVKA